MRIKRSHIAAIHDLLMAAVSFILSLYLRVGDEIINFPQTIFIGAIVFAGIASAVFLTLKLYAGIWRYASVQDLIAICKATVITMLLFIPVMFLINRLEGIPRSVFFINALLLLVLLGGPRFVYRAIRERRFRNDQQQLGNKKINILLVDLNDNAELFLRKISRSPNPEYNVVGIIDEDKSKAGSYLYNVKILGNYASIPVIYEKLKQQHSTPQKLLITSDYIDGQVVRNLLSVADLLGMTLAKLPKLTDFKNTSENRLEIKEIVIQDLLGRAQNTIDHTIISQQIKGKRVLVTGSGGTIGSELTRQVAAYEPGLLIMLDHSEYGLYKIDKEIETKFPAITRTPIIASVQNKVLIEQVFAEYKPEIVFHAAALKHVPLVESNSCEAVLTNILGTKNIADSCLKYSAEKMILISTDKAVNPTNVMGATKKAAESYVHSLGNSSTYTNFVTVRFGNVLGSSGSVIPLFERQLKAGGPLTVTHPNMVRFFMTVREAVGLVLQASSIKVNDERGAIFVLDMGEPLKIKDLAMQIIKMAGLRPDIDIEIVYTGIRPGEKLFEELFYASEQPKKTAHQSIMLACPVSLEQSMLLQLLNDIEVSALSYNQAETLSLLKKIVPEYQTPIQ